MPARRTVTGVFNWCEASAENLAERCNSALVDSSAASARFRSRGFAPRSRRVFPRVAKGAARNEMAGEQAAYEQGGAREEDMPAYLLPSRERVREWINRYFVRRRKKGTRIELLYKRADDDAPPISTWKLFSDVDR